MPIGNSIATITTSVSTRPRLSSTISAEQFLLATIRWWPRSCMPACFYDDFSITLDYYYKQAIFEAHSLPSRISMPILPSTFFLILFSSVINFHWGICFGYCCCFSTIMSQECHSTLPTK